MVNIINPMWIYPKWKEIGFGNLKILEEKNDQENLADITRDVGFRVLGSTPTNSTTQSDLICDHHQVFGCATQTHQSMVTYWFWGPAPRIEKRLG